MSQVEQTTQTPEERIAELESRVQTLEDTLIATNDALTNVNKTLVELTADHIQRLFQEPVLIDSIAQRILIAGANAIAHKAKHSKERAPELVVVEGYVPGAIRVTLTDNGPVIEEQVKGTQEWVSGDALSEGLKDERIAHVMGDLLISYGAVVDRPYYVVDSVELEEFRKETSKKALQVTAQVDQAEEASDTPAQ